MRTDILGVGFDDLTLEEAAAAGASLVEDQGFHYAVTPNPEFLLAARKDQPFRQALLDADLVLADGVGVVYSAKLLGRPLKGRVPGIEFAQALMGWMAKHGKRLFLLGAKPGVAELAAANLRDQYPGLILCGTHDGYFKEDEPVVQAIRESGADVVFVCLGAPKQEFWMAKHGPATGAHLMVGLGGSLDVFAGVVERAPEGFQKLGLEWLYRLMKEPKRFGRMAKLPLVLVYALAGRIGGK
ncbi:WecB/TagA/CpsF family glycosyltransferase [Pseudoflavonifractor phocaeensis]|uniref:WecB/TagA/CpsF family glycosyltransferase n=1 Tax=Pseudoflavonifractor phocaeensis TaxID=1870988 RepID=UPI00195B3532|nr:WecB/TagA/CpsF family glycosyltransferase [Pseudoflavonifractor phocaeensis]MBM6722183.1 WecB/TagA/CpsF family glycosyltransferase [Pseudoflavonifractor phocaeensis]